MSEWATPAERDAAPVEDLLAPENFAEGGASVRPADSAAPAGLRWVWAEELVTESPEEPDWVWEGYVALGAKTLLAGLPKGGKTTLVRAVTEAFVSDGAESFLGHAVGNGFVLLASEEGNATLPTKLRDLPPRRVRVLSRDTAWPKPSWADLIASATAEAARLGGPVLLVIDSLAFWAALDPEREKDAGTAQAVSDALDQTARAGLAVLLIHHQRKAAGEHGTGVRGSGAWAGAMDAIIEYERLDDWPPSHRRLVSLSRDPFTDGVLVIDHDLGTDSWRVVAESDSREGADKAGVRERILAVIPTEPPGATEQEQADALDLDKRKISGPLRDLIGEEVERTGEGKKGDPYRYWRNAAPNAAPDGGRNGQKADSVSPASPVGGGRNESFSPAEPFPPAAGEKADAKSQPGSTGCPSHRGDPRPGCRYCAERVSEAGLTGGRRRARR
jgi:hypothetical protein